MESLTQVLYTVTFKSGAQQEFDLDADAIVNLIDGFKAVNERGVDGILSCGDAAFLLSTVAGFGPYIPMSQKYEAPSIPLRSANRAETPAELLPLVAASAASG
jgi:hypothetical protein